MIPPPSPSTDNRADPNSTLTLNLTLPPPSAAHGQWLPWLEANRDALGFDAPRIAQRLIKAASNTTLTTHLDDPVALIAINRLIHGNADRTARLLMAAANRASTHDLDDPATAVAINRQLWGNTDSQLVQQSLSNEHYTPKQYLAARLMKVAAKCDASDTFENPRRVVGTDQAAAPTRDLLGGDPGGVLGLGLGKW
jgi:hypothetical protein